MFTISDRYTAKLFLGFFLGALLVFVSLFIAVDFLSKGIKFEASGEILFQYYKYSIPAVVYQMIPISCIVATIFTLSNMNRNNELVALFSFGMSLARISAPILVIVSFISIFSFVLSDKIIPSFTKKKNYVYYKEIRKKPGLYSMLKNNRIWYRSGNILFNLKTLNPEARKAQGVSFYYFDEMWNLLQVISAKNLFLGDDSWRLQEGKLTVFLSQDEFPLIKEFAEKEIHINEEMKDLQSSSDTVDMMNVSELRRFLKKNQDAGLDTIRYEVAFNSKFAYAFSAFVLALLGIPFSVRHQRSGGIALQIATCLGLVFLFWIANSSFQNMGKYGYVNPIIGAWAANVLLLAFTMFMLLRLRK